MKPYNKLLVVVTVLNSIVRIIRNNEVAEDAAQNQSLRDVLRQPVVFKRYFSTIRLSETLYSCE
jgi:hypothetical protein